MTTDNPRTIDASDPGIAIALVQLYVRCWACDGSGGWWTNCDECNNAGRILVLGRRP